MLSGFLPQLQSHEAKCNHLNFKLDSDRHAFHQLNTVLHGGQIKSLCWKRWTWGLELSTELSVPPINTVPHGGQIKSLCWKRRGLELGTELSDHQKVVTKEAGLELCTKPSDYTTALWGIEHLGIYSTYCFAHVAEHTWAVFQHQRCDYPCFCYIQVETPHTWAVFQHQRCDYPCFCHIQVGTPHTWAICSNKQRMPSGRRWPTSAASTKFRYDLDLVQPSASEDPKVIIGILRLQLQRQGWSKMVVLKSCMSGLLSAMVIFMVSQTPLLKSVWRERKTSHIHTCMHACTHSPTQSVAKKLDVAQTDFVMGLPWLTTYALIHTHTHTHSRIHTHTHARTHTHRALQRN